MENYKISDEEIKEVLECMMSRRMIKAREILKGLERLEEIKNV